MNDTPTPTTTPKYVKLNLPGAPTMLVTHKDDSFLHCTSILMDFTILDTLVHATLLDRDDLIPCHANGEPLEPHETQDGRLVRSSWTWDEDDREWVSNTGSSVGRHVIAHDGGLARNLFTCVGRDVALAKFDEWAFEAPQYTNPARGSIVRGSIELFDRDSLCDAPTKELDVIDLLTRVPDARQRLRFDRPPNPWAFEDGVWRRWHGDDVEQVLDRGAIVARAENPRLGYLFGTLVAQVGEREALERVGLGDSGEVPDKGDWIPAGDITRALLDTCLIWEENTNGHVELWLSHSLDLSDLYEGMWRPVPLAGMDENGVIAAADMTQAHFDRVSKWQWREGFSSPGAWQSWPGPKGGNSTMAYVDQSNNEEWRPAVALGSRHVGEKIDK